MNTKFRAVLLVEDNPSDVGLTRRAFEKARIANPLIVADDGQEALDYLCGAGAWAGRDVADAPALILLDLNLPKVSGLEVLRRIRETGPVQRVPVVILTSSKEEQDLKTGYDSGVNSYIVKPIDFTQFVDAIRHLGLYWLVLNEPPPRAN